MLDELVRELPTPLFVISANSEEILYCNPAMENLFSKDWVHKTKSDLSQFFSANNSEACFNVADRVLNEKGFATFTYNTFNPKLGKMFISVKNITYKGVDSTLYYFTTTKIDDFLSKQLTVETTLLQIIKDFSSDPENAIGNLVEKIKDTYSADSVFVFMDEEPFDKYFFTAPKNSLTITNIKKFLIKNFSNVRHLYNNYPANSIRKLSLKDFNSVYNKFEHNPFIKSIGLNSEKYIIPIKYSSGISNEGMLIIFNPHKNTEDFSLAISISKVLNFFFYVLRTQNQLEKLSFSDSLTSICNRNSFDRIKYNYQKNPPASLGIMYLDINGLKFSNDTYGHDFGDTIIISTAEALQRVFRKNNIYRIGGDEFVVAIANIEKEVFRKKVQTFKDILSKDKYANVSIGVSYNNENVSILKLLESADKEMYTQKNTFYQLQNEQHFIGNKHLTYLKEEIRNGIKTKQFDVHIRPRFNMLTNSICGGDSILHINRPLFNITNPYQLVHLLERADLMYEIDCYMIKLNCIYHSKLIKKYGESLVVSINFSNKTFLHEDFKNYLIKTANEYKVPYKYLNLQIIYLEKQISPELIATVNELHDLGFHTSINHFGVGDSVFTPLQSLALNSIKLDNTLTPALETEKGRITLKSILHMNDELGIDTCIDYIDNEEQIKQAIKIGFTYGRGNYYSRAVDFEELENTFFKPYIEVRSKKDK